MASNVIRREFFSWDAPAGGVDVGVPSVVSCVASDTSVVVTFDEAMRAAPAFAQFSATVDGVARDITAASVTGAALTLTLDPAVVADEVVVVSYVPGATASARLADAARGNEVGAASPLASAIAT